MRRPALVLMLCAFAGACATAGPWPSAGPGPRPDVDRGQRFAQRACAGCHEIAAQGESPRSGAPAFGTLRRRYTSLQMVRRLTAISRDGHYEMPPIYISEDEAKDVAAYVESLGDRPG